MIRLTLTRGPGPMGLDISLCPDPTFLALAFPLNPLPASLYQKGISLQVTEVVRNSVKAIPPSAKTANFLNNILAGIEARQKGAREAVLLNDKGFVTEGSVTNIFIVKKGRLITPAAQTGILLGVTRKVVLEIARKEGLPVEERHFRPASLFSADECFVTSSSYEIMPATRMNGKRIGAGKPGPITGSLIYLFRELTFTSPVHRSAQSVKEKGKFN
ncbi:MAG TPA: aminotransferase class IV, partial [Nitrospiria bacterium]|nr:aminotransferase class IV [Nitrospiria bacterium]